MANQNLKDRLLRARSWLDVAFDLEHNAQQKHVPNQTIFIYRFISLNALYGRRQYEGSKTLTRQDFESFWKNILILDKENQRIGGNLLANGLKECRQQWLSLIDNEFLDNGYWRTPIHRENFKRKYHLEVMESLDSFGHREYKELLNNIFSRIVVLRNQIFHGCATYGPASKGLKSVEAANPVLRELVPVFYKLMDQHGHIVSWPKIPYPRLHSEQHPSRPFDPVRF